MSTAPVLVLAIFLVLYLLPCWIARLRHVDKSTGIGLLNLFLGWTVLGWFAALIWACTAETTEQAHLRAALYRQMGYQVGPAAVVPQRSQNAVAVGRAVGQGVHALRSEAPVFKPNDRPVAGSTTLGLSGDVKPIVREP